MLSILGQDVGFFKNLHSLLCKHFSEADLDGFSALGNDCDRFVYIHNKIHSNSGLVDSEEYTQVLKSRRLPDCKKSSEITKELKQDGNKAFQANLYKESFQKYSRAILKCPQNDKQNKEELAVLYANRSAALYHLNEYQNAISDIESALKFNFPKELQYKVYDRKARCLLAQKRHRLAVDAFRRTLTALDDAKLPLERKQKWQKDVQIMLAMLAKNAELIKNEPLTSEEKVADCPKLSKKPSKSHPAVIDSIQFNKSEISGRFAEAKQTIKAGDIIAVEKPYCAVLLEEFTVSHCFNCLKRLELLHPCPTCSAVSFCSDNCKDIAMGSHHKIECSILPSLWSSGMSITCLMALRMISQKSLKYFNQIKSDLNKLDGNEDLSKSFNSDDYRSVFNLERNLNQRSAEDLLQRTHMAVFLFRTLKSTQYFKNEGDELLTNGTSGKCKSSLSNDEVYIGGLILRNLQFLQFNAHEVSELHFVKNDPDQSKSVFVGGAIYPTLSLFNHSCNPGFVRYFKGTTVICQAIRTTYAGEMVAENYGPMFTLSSKPERQSTLRSQYWFDCSCVACLENWPLFEEMDESKMRFKCLTEGCRSVLNVPVDTMKFMAHCPVCNEHTNLFKGLKSLQDTDAVFRVARTVMLAGDTSRALAKFIELLKMLEETLTPPFKDFHLCQQASRTCMLALGNCHVITTANNN
ncbi:hypothetical protein LSTR_LSTR011282 [Laodelphax striatellus]|uniref:MYND-type domain-containing protein n=1 Tax=Laodelphax striatellus TaxID=195883 RepID=A0A482X4D3_LAOST|nr:hypothetical protein LSTR_LSTR011282 [Laodelphax striatellus]